MLKKIFESAITGSPKAPSYEVPDELPSLDPSVNNVLPKIKLPDSIKQYMTDPAFTVEESPGAVVPGAKEFSKDVAGEAFAGAVEQANGNSATFLSSLLKDPRFALISVKFLAFGMKKETAVLWAAESASLGYAIAGQQKGNDAVKMSPAEEAAVEQARFYAAGKKITPEKISGLVTETGMDKPGASAALAASWAQDPPPPEAGDSRALVGEMVSSAVLLSAAMTLPAEDDQELLEVPEVPVAQANMPEDNFSIIPEDSRGTTEMAAALKPFMDKGLDLAAMS